MKEEKKEAPAMRKKEYKKQESLLKMFDKTIDTAGEIASLVTGIRQRQPDLVMKNGKKRAL